MNSLVTIFSFVVLVGLSCCMRILEDDGGDDEQSPNVGGWGFSFGINIGREDKLATSEDNLSAAGELCNVSDFSVVVDHNKEKIAYKYKGCIKISKAKKGYTFTLVLDGQDLVKQTFQEMNKEERMTCVHAKKIPHEADVCPVLYNVNMGKGKFCGRLVENFKRGDTQIHHEVELGCTTVV